VTATVVPVFQIQESQCYQYLPGTSTVKVVSNRGCRDLRYGTVPGTIVVLVPVAARERHLKKVYTRVGEFY
jgi:hypothetical protein